MNAKGRLSAVLMSALMLMCGGRSQAQELPSRPELLRSMELANEYFMNKVPDPGAPTFVKKERPSNLWTRGVYYEGLFSLMEIEEGLSPDKHGRYLDYIRRWGEAHKWAPRNGVQTRDADDYCCSQAYVDMYVYGGMKDDALVKPSRQCVDNIMSAPDSKGDWTWIDAIQMGLPVFSKLARARYLAGDYADAIMLQDWGWRMYEYSRDSIAGGLYDRGDGLWWRDKDFVAPYKEPNGADCFWSRGNGWVYAALARAMEASLIGESSDAPMYREKLGETKWRLFFFDSHYEAYKADFTAMSEALLKCQRKDGLWNASLHDEGNYGGKELTGTSLFVYGMAWGVRHGILPADKYLPVISKSWNALVKYCLHDNGFLGYVQGTGKEPKDSQPVGYDTVPDFEDYGLGCFLLAGTEIYKLQWH